MSKLHDAVAKIKSDLEGNTIEITDDFIINVCKDVDDMKFVFYRDSDLVIVVLFDTKLKKDRPVFIELTKNQATVRFFCSGHPLKDINPQTIQAALRFGERGESVTYLPRNQLKKDGDLEPWPVVEDVFSDLRNYCFYSKEEAHWTDVILTREC